MELLTNAGAAGVLAVALIACLECIVRLTKIVADIAKSQCGRNAEDSHRS